MGDREAFETFLKDEMPRICHVVNFNIDYRGSLQPMQKILYKWLRCHLTHEATLPPDIHFEPDSQPGIKHTAVAPDGALNLSHGWLDGLTDAIIHAPENKSEFGDPPKLPFPIHLPKIGLTIGT